MIRYPKPTDLSHLCDSRIGNPDYDRTDIIANGGFDADSDWLKAGTAAIASGVGTLTGDSTTNNHLQQHVLTVGKSYLVTYTVTANTLVGGTANTRIYCPNTTSYWFKDSVGTHYIQFTALATGFYFRTLGTITGGSISFDNVSVTEWSGEELVPDPDVGFVANDVSKWTVFGTNTVEQDGNAVKITYVNNGAGAYVRFQKTTTGSTFNDVVVGEKNRIVVKAKYSGSGSATVGIYGTGLLDSVTISNTEYQVFVFDITNDNTAPYIALGSFGAGEIVWIEILSVMKVTGLVAAYNMIPNGDTLVDISGNTGNASLSGSPFRTEDGLKFRLGDSIQIGTPNPVDIWGVKFRIKIQDVSSLQYFIGRSGGSTVGNIGISAGEYLTFRENTGAYTTHSFTGLQIQFDKFYNVIMTSDGTLVHCYVNGVYIGNVTPADVDIEFDAFGGIKNTANVDIEFADYQQVNYTIQLQEAKDYHNQFAKRISKKGNFTDFPVGSTI